VWDAGKAATNTAKHEVAFEKACEVFFDPFVRIEDASPEEEKREAAIGRRKIGNCFSSSILYAKKMRSAFFHCVRRRHRNGGDMKTSERLKKRLQKDRAMTTISMRLPEDVIEDLKEIAPALGFSGYQPLIRAYIGQGLRKDLARMENSQVQILADSLRRHGVKDEVISEAIAEARLRIA
jgi:uncharacterized DUF497 family protein